MFDGSSSADSGGGGTSRSEAIYKTYAEEVSMSGQYTLTYYEYCLCMCVYLCKYLCTYVRKLACLTDHRLACSYDYCDVLCRQDTLGSEGWHWQLGSVS